MLSSDSCALHSLWITVELYQAFDAQNNIVNNIDT